MKWFKWLLLLLFLFLLFFPLFAQDIDINSIIILESSGNPNAYNPESGCIGLTQVNPRGALEDWNNSYNDRYHSCLVKVGFCNKATIENGELVNCEALSYYVEDEEKCKKETKNYNIGDLYNPKINVKIGTWYINQRIPQMLKAYDIEDTIENRLIAYHDGIGNLQKYLKGKRKLGKAMKSYLIKYKKLKERWNKTWNGKEWREND